MKTSVFFLRDIEYYVWWLKNCSAISPEQCKEEIKPLIKKLNVIYRKTGILYFELKFLEELREFDYSLFRYKKYQKENEQSLICHFS